MALGGAVLLGALLLPLLERHRRPERPGGRAHRPGPLELGLLAVSAIPVTLAAIFAWSQAAHPGPVAGELPGMATAVTAACAATLAAILLVPLLLGAEAITRRGHAAEPGRFRWCAPFVTLALGVWALNTVMLGTLIQVAGMTGRIAYAERLPAGGAATVAVFPGVRHAATFLIVLPALVLALFGCHQLAMYLRARFGREREQVREHYRRLERERPGDVWLASAVAGPGSPGWLGVRGWPGRVAGARRLARATLELDRPATGMVAGLLCLWPVLGDRLPEGAIGAGTAAAALLPVLLLGLLRSGWRDLDRRRTVGVLWDVGTFWPRSYHPWPRPRTPSARCPTCSGGCGGCTTPAAGW
ncbi:hypothetical protein [Thermocatellispora tengchongensis]|uniref:hypothetical protein n=1 Tax=Thermocatellispora tengchongensis TaxID=1073253 RepID=UPI003645C4D5